MVTRLDFDKKKPVQELGLPVPCALWPVDLKLTHIDCNSDATLVHFQGQYHTISELDYNILQLEIQNAQKTRWMGEVGELCLVEDVLSNRWYRGRVQNKQNHTFDVFLIDYGNVLSVDMRHLALGSDEIFMLPSKIVCGFFANVLPVRESWDAQSERYFSSLVGSSMKGYIQALLPHKVLILEAPDINKDLNQMGFGRHVDTDTFLLLVEILTEIPLKPSRDPVPDLLIDKPTGQEFSFNPSSLQGFEDILSFCGPKLSAGKKVKVRITAAVSPCRFYCQLTSMATDLQIMSEELAASCENKSKDSTQKTLENLGLLCSVRGKDEKWHRGFVQFLPVNSRVRVLFVDYGFCESVKVEHVLQLPTRFLSVPIAAFPCALSCLEKNDEAAKTEQLSLLKKGLLGDDLEAHIDRFDEERNFFSVTMFSAEDDIGTQKEPVHNVTDHLNSHMHFESTLMEILDDSVQVEEMADDFVFEGYVEHILNPSQFWMRTAKRNCDFEAMMDCLDKHFNQIQLNEDILANPVPGTICCAMYEKDMHYYRAIVTDTLKHGAEVFFMDFGNTEKVPHMLLKIIPDKLASVPAFAFSCSLVNVMPIDDDLWTSTTTNYFRHAASNKAFLVHVVHVQKDRFVVDLLETGNQNHMSISELLTRTNHAMFWKYTPSNPAVSAVLSKKTNRKLKLRNLEQGNEVSGASTQDICKKTSQVTDTNTTETTKSTLVFKKLTFRPGSELAVRCSHVNSPSDFWCQVKRKIPALDRLMDELQQVYGTHATPLQPGESCCMVKCEHDGRWYRACIIGKSMKKDDYDVICVDYGITVRGKVHLLKAILPKHFEIEGQAFRCSLYNLIEPADATSENWHPDAQVLLKDFVQEPSLICSIRSQLYLKNHGLYNVVDLLSGHHSAAKILVEQGLAREVNTCVKLGPAVVPYSFAHSSFNLNTGSVEQVYTTHVVSPWEMYCQLDRNSGILEDLMETVSKEIKKIQSDKTRTTKWSNLCLAKYYSDGRWYRGMVWPVLQSSLLNFFFVDYGNTNTIEKSNVISIPSESTDLLFTPMQALRCSLAQIPKQEDFIVVHHWLEKSVLNQPLRAVVVGKAEDGTFEIDLFDGDVHINKKVKELIAGQVSKSEQEVVCAQKNITGKNEKTPTKKAMCPKNQCEKKFSPPSKSTASKWLDTKQQPQVIERSCHQHDPNSPLAKPLRTVELPTLSSLPKGKITAGFRGLGFISHVNYVSSFFIQMQDDEPSILKMGEDLNSELLKDTLKNNSVSLKINDLVVAEFEEDGALYRAVVKDFEPNGQYKLEFIDYGNTAVMRKEKTYGMISAWLSQPRLSIPCSLLDTSCFDSDALFIDAVMGKPLMVEFVSCFGLQWEVNIEIRGQVDKPLAVWPDAASSQVSQSNDELLAVTDQNKRPCHPSPSPVTKRQSMDRFALTARGEKIVLKVCHRPHATVRLRKTRRQLHNRNAKTAKTVLEGVSKIDRETVSKGVSSKTDRETVLEGVSSKTDRETVSEMVPSKTDRETVLEGVASKTDRETVSEGVSSKTDSETVSEVVSSKSDSSPLQRLFLAPINTDQTYFGFAAAVTTPYNFYIVLEDLLLIMNAVSTILEDLPSELPSLPEADLKPLTCCLVRCDTKWCRAEVVHADRATTVVVNLVDYGHCVDTSYQEHSMLKRMPEQLTRLPKVTYPCALRGVKPVTDEWTDEAALFFQESICQRNLEIRFRHLVSEERLEVDLVTGGTYVAKELVDAGHASYVDAMLGLRFQERSPIKSLPGLGLAEGRVTPDQRSALDLPEDLLNTSKQLDAEESTRTNEQSSMADERRSAEGCPSSAKATPEEQESLPLIETLKDQTERMGFLSLSETRQCSLM